MGSWRSLTAAAVRELAEINQQVKGANIQREDSTEKKFTMILEKAQAMQYSKAMNLLRSPGLSKDEPSAILQQLTKLHPQEQQWWSEDDIQHPGERSTSKSTLDFINAAWVKKQIRKSSAGTAVDQWGWDSKEMWTVLCEDEETAEDLAQHWFKPTAAGYLPNKYRTHLAGGRLVALSKAPKPGIRPICISDALRRLTAKGLGAACAAHFNHFFQKSEPNVLQFGGNTKNGATNMYHMLKSIGDIAETDTNVEDPIVILTLDSSNAFNSLKRAHLISVLRQGCEHFVGPEQCSEDGKVIGWDILWRHIEANYGVHGVLKFFHNGEVDEVLSEAGVQQGDPLGSVLYVLAIHPALLRIGRRFGEVFVGGYADNISLAGRLSIVAQAYEMYEQEMTNLGLTINLLESEIYVPQWKNNNLEQLESELVIKQHGPTSS